MDFQIVQHINMSNSLRFLNLAAMDFMHELKLNAIEVLLKKLRAQEFHDVRLRSKHQELEVKQQTPCRRRTVTGKRQVATLIMEVEAIDAVVACVQDALHVGRLLELQSPEVRPLQQRVGKSMSLPWTSGMRGDRQGRE
ncbi:hypothetical protein DYB37_009644 [Aphanomyces astaci]|uniref:Uncharacterized protein n=1 Tax=Aphanomyces astaci TaxID=112090 RepID=A0A3L6VPF6_APHAT|nr:hypothetical protein DYB35_009216 [Aphanomyces astaci]RHZ12070.1 hypothetical protein DYB37_009644 [Aphanomyces astaci]RLO10593.1 hypothetical protein DYB28_009022 [Aphanomyces astaci]